MCGIVGYLGPQEATPILLEGLHRLEYRGYDSSGVSVLGEDGTLTTIKKPGKISVLDPQTQLRKPKGRIWTHPVIINGRLYLRDQDLIYCYDVKSKDS